MCTVPQCPASCALKPAPLPHPSRNRTQVPRRGPSLPPRCLLFTAGTLTATRRRPADREGGRNPSPGLSSQPAAPQPGRGARPHFLSLLGPGLVLPESKWGRNTVFLMKPMKRRRFSQGRGRVPGTCSLPKPSSTPAKVAGQCGWGSHVLPKIHVPSLSATPRSGF